MASHAGTRIGNLRSTHSHATPRVVRISTRPADEAYRELVAQRIGFSSTSDGYFTSGGTLGNTHFVAIPYNATSKAGALVLANFLISPEAQARKQDPNIWGDPTVLNVTKLDADDQAKFAALDLGIATLKPEELGPMLPEPHPSWMTAIEKEWTRRYSAGN